MASDPGSLGTMAPSLQQTHRLVHTCGSHDPAAGFSREKATPAARACPYSTPCCRPAARGGQGSGPKATAQPGDRKAAVVQGPRAEQLQQKAGRERWEVAAVAHRDRWGTVHVPREQAGGQRGARLHQHWDLTAGVPSTAEGGGSMESVQQRSEGRPGGCGPRAGRPT